jgi:hypothetical protein
MAYMGLGLGLLVSSRLHDHTFRHTTVGRTPLDEWPARRRDFYLTTHNTHKRQTSMHPAGFEPTILVSERPKTHALDRTATGIGSCYITVHYLVFSCPYICFGTSCAILRGVVESSQFSNASNSLSQHKFTITEYHYSILIKHQRRQADRHEQEVTISDSEFMLWKWIGWVWKLWTLDDTPEDGTRSAETYVGTRKH